MPNTLKTWHVEAMRLDTEPEEEYKWVGEARTVEMANTLAQQDAWNRIGAQADLRIYNSYHI